MEATRVVRMAGELDALRSDTAPFLRAAVRLMGVLTTGAAAAYFFRHDYANAKWLRPLAEVGAFKTYSRVHSGKLMRWVIFRELTGYLHRVAKAEPEQVAGVLKSLVTKDTWATGQLMKAALALPNEHVAQVVPQFVKWCGPGNPFAREEEVIALAERMLRAGHTEAFTTLLELLLRPVLTSERGDVTGYFLADNLSEFVRQEYQGLCQEEPSLCLGVAERALRKAVPLLEKSRAARWGDRSGKEQRRPPSSSWRSAIEDHPQNGHPGFEDGLLEAVRDALAHCVEKDPQKAKATVERYHRASWPIFQRLALHAITENAKHYPDLAARVAVRPARYDNYEFYHEYWRLAATAFDSLEPKAKKTLLSWVLGGREGDDEEHRKWRAHRRLTMLRDCHLPDYARQRLDELTLELGELAHPDLLSYHTVSVGGGPGATSPVSLESKTNDEIMTILTEWRPPAEVSRFDDPVEGLAAELRRVVSQDPVGRLPLAGLIDKLKGRIDDERASLYIRAFLDAYWEACRANQKFDWEPVIGLADRLVARDASDEAWDDARPPQPDEDRDRGWPSVRSTITRLMETGFAEKREKPIPDVHLPKVRGILTRLARDPFPSGEYERRREQERRDLPKAAPLDWFEMSVNSNRGQAAHALIRYAIRYGRGVFRDDKQAPRLEPDVRGALDTLAADPCRSVHAALGSWLGALWWLDSDWVRKNAELVLPEQPDEQEHWEAGWSAYLRYGILNPNLREFLVPHYVRSIEFCGPRKEDDEHLVGLCKHLAAIYTWGWEEFADTDLLISRFYRGAGDDAACELAQSLGYFVRNPEKAEGEDPEQWRRQWCRIVESLLPWRIGHIAENPERHAKELRTFAGWLDAMQEHGAGDLGAITYALDVITAVRLFHLQFERVVELLDAQADRYPGVAARLLRQMLLKCDRDAWYWEREHISSILGKAFSSSDRQAHRDAVTAIELLWAEGEWEPFERYKDQVRRAAG